LIDPEKQSKADKAIIITMLGFTGEAAKVANCSRGKIVLLTEAKKVKAS
jgi:hypothetical protein